MKVSDIVAETFPVGQFHDDGVDKDWVYEKLFKQSKKIKNVNADLAIYFITRNGEFWYLLVKNDRTVAGIVKSANRNILSVTYLSIDLIFIFPEFRKSSAIKWLLYSVKELTDYPIIADGAIFTGGLELILSLIKHKLIRCKSLNKLTGEKQQIDSIIFDPDLCYLFEQTKLGFGKNYFSEDATSEDKGWVWYNLFETF